jgi:hypothetical protein
MSNTSLQPRHLATALVGALTALHAASGLAQQSPPSGLPDRGVLRLQLGSRVQQGGLHAPPRFVHEPSGLSQAINLSGSCTLVLGGPNSLATLQALGGLGLVGLTPTSIGVDDGVPGPACSRFSAELGESLTVGLGPDLAGPVIDANAFWRLTLDVEVKRNAEFLLQVLANGTVTDEFRLRTGTSIVPGEGSATPGSPDRILNCSAVPDSVPDIGGRDNCRWTVDALGNAFRLVPLQGKGSLEGGGDWSSAAYANNTLIFLTEGAVGAVGCTSSQVPEETTTAQIGDGVNDARCGVTRIDPTGLGGSCTTAVGYILRNTGQTVEGCELVKAPGEELAASVNIEFPPEARTGLGSEPRTEILFSTPTPGVVVPFVPERCVGTVVPDRNGEPTIAEVLSVPGFAPDLVPATPEKDWACVLESRQNYLGGGQMQVIQRILFWGDITFQRRVR